MVLLRTDQLITRLNDHITSIETFFDIFYVVVSHGLLCEIKSTSIHSFLAEMGERLELTRQLNKEIYDGLQELERLANEETQQII
jgi:hypothetical protein